MKKTLLTTLSMVALLGAAPAIAADDHKDPSTTQKVKSNVKEGWNDLKKDTSEAYGDLKENTSEAYHDIKAAVLNEDGKEDMVTISTRSTATGMIGQPIFNDGKRVGKIHDIILDKDGTPELIVVANGDFFGLGKLAAFQYDDMIKTNADGELVAPLTEDTIKRAAEFSYDKGEVGENVRVMSDSGYSVNQLLDGQVVDQEGETVAQIDDIHFKGKDAAHLIVAFNEILGFGGKQAALNYNAGNLVKDGDTYNVKLSAQEAEIFNKYKKTTAKN